jgi:hypothetical protein
MIDPRLHGPKRCPRAPAGCEACEGYHHWLEHGFDPSEEPPEEDSQALAVLAYDREHGTDHALAFYGCKHCDAWAEAELVWELEGEEDEA